MFKKFREFFVDESDVTKLVTVIRNSTGNIPAEVNVGCCGWAKAPNCWFVHVHLNNARYYEILKESKKSGIEILPVTTGY